MFAPAEWSLKSVLELYRLRREGMKIEALADYFHVTEETIRGKLGGLKPDPKVPPPPSKRPRRRLSNRRKSQIYDLSKRLGVRQVAKMLGVSGASVMKYRYLTPKKYLKTPTTATHIEI